MVAVSPDPVIGHEGIAQEGIAQEGIAQEGYVASMAGKRFLPAQRIRHTSEFRRVYARRCAASDNVLLVYGCENDLDSPRLGLSVSRKVGIAVRRNRWKRIIREAFRLRLSEIPAGIDWVVIPRGKRIPDLADVETSLLALTARVAAKLERPAGS